MEPVPLARELFASDIIRAFAVRRWEGTALPAVRAPWRAASCDPRVLDALFPSEVERPVAEACFEETLAVGPPSPRHEPYVNPSYDGRSCPSPSRGPPDRFDSPSAGRGALRRPSPLAAAATRPPGSAGRPGAACKRSRSWKNATTCCSDSACAAISSAVDESSSDADAFRCVT